MRGIIVELAGGADCLRRIRMPRTGGRYVIVGVLGVQGKLVLLP